jgi:hypothetical protein
MRAGPADVARVLAICLRTDATGMMVLPRMPPARCLRGTAMRSSFTTWALRIISGSQVGALQACSP